MGFLKKLVFLGGGSSLIVAGGAGVVYKRRLKENRSISSDNFNANQCQEDLQAALDSIKNQRNGNGEQVPLKLFRYTTCPFCGKAKAFLDYYKIQHDCVEVEPMFKGEIKESKYKKVPQCQFQNGSKPYLVDSGSIVNTLAKTVGVEDQLDDDDINKWRDWAKDSLVRYFVLNINDTLWNAWRGYDYIDQFDTIPYRNKLFLKVMGAPVMYCVARWKTRPTLIQNGELKEGDDIRQILHSQVERFSKEAIIPENGPFHGGKTPDLADLDVYGVFQSIRGHSVYEDLIQSTSIAPWITNMDAAVRGTQ